MSVQQALIGQRKNTGPDQAERDEAWHEQFEKLEPPACRDPRDQAHEVARRRQAIDARENGVALFEPSYLIDLHCVSSFIFILSCYKRAASAMLPTLSACSRSQHRSSNTLVRCAPRISSARPWNFISRSASLIGRAMLPMACGTWCSITRPFSNVTLMRTSSGAISGSTVA